MAVAQQGHHVFGVSNRMRIAQEEVFGPVLSVIKFKDEDEAIEIANNIAYGLGAGVWTQSLKRAHTMARRIRAGTVWINTYRAVSFMMPFGGYKASGLGRCRGSARTEPGEHDQTVSALGETA
jgi:acyl-CoA reductase-like NAD-dependent aldehyde dehydrogenase